MNVSVWWLLNTRTVCGTVKVKSALFTV